MQSLPNRLSVAIHATTGLFIDSLREEGEMANKMSRHFYKNHQDQYQAALLTLSNKK